MILAKCNRVGDLTYRPRTFLGYIPVMDLCVLVSQYAVDFDEMRFEEILYREMVRYQIPGKAKFYELREDLFRKVENHRNPLIRKWMSDFYHPAFFSFDASVRQPVCSRPRCWMNSPCRCTSPLIFRSLCIEVAKIESRRRKARKRLR